MKVLKCLIALLMLTILPTIACGGDYVIGEGDGLDVSVWGVKELDVAVRVRPDGKITLPGLGDVEASGLQPRELQKVLGEKLKELVKNPIVTVTVKEITNSRVYVFGGGVQSGVFDLNRRTTLLQLLCSIGITGRESRGGSVASGGRAPDYKRAYLTRGGKKIKENFHTLFIDGNIGEDIVIESNDAIFIPELSDRNIYILGAVNMPKSIEFREGMTVMEAILESGGFTKFASQNGTNILRKEDGKDVSIPIKAKDLIKHGDLKQNVHLKPGDYIIVNESLF